MGNRTIRWMLNGALIGLGLFALATVAALPAKAQTVRLQVNSGLTVTRFTLSASTPAAVLPTVQNYVSRTVCNIDTTITEYFGPSNVTSSTGFPLKAGQCWDFSHTTAAVYMIAASGTPEAATVGY